MKGKSIEHKNKKALIDKNWAFPANLIFQAPIYLQSDGGNLLYIKVLMISNRTSILKYLRFTTLVCKYVWIRKSEFLTQFLYFFCFKAKGSFEVSDLVKLRRSRLKYF